MLFEGELFMKIMDNFIFCRSDNTLLKTRAMGIEMFLYSLSKMRNIDVLIDTSHYKYTQNWETCISQLLRSITVYPLIVVR